MKLQGTMPMFFNGAKVSDKLYKMLRDHQAWSETPKALQPLTSAAAPPYVGMSEGSPFA